MPERVSDEAIARHLLQIGMARAEQVALARELQTQSAQQGRAMSLAEALVRQGAITAVQRDEIEKRLLTQQNGAQQFGQYKLLRKIGGGAMGTVYLAEDSMAQRKVALKVLQDKYAADPEFLTRFRREARAAGKLSHPNIVAAYTIGEEAGRQFYTMEFCEGETLGKMLDRAKVLPWDLALGIVIQVARGLQHAHKHGVIHRDIKPDNVFIASDPNGSIAGPSGSKGVAKILDLGLSKNIGDEHQSFYTQTGVAMGTPHYISPEQARGDKGIDGRTDIYSLGATFYHLVTGQTPFSGTTAAMVMMKHLGEQLPNPQDVVPDIPDGIVQVIQKMMAKDPADRYVDCGALLEDLELVREGKTPSSPAMDAARSTIGPRVGRSVRSPHVGRFAKSPHKRGSVADTLIGPHGASVPPPAARSRKPVYIAAAVLGLGAITFIVALLPRGESKTAKPDTRDPIPDTRAVAVQPETVNLKPETRPWPLHDGKEPIADYAKRVGLPATETLDLGGGVKMEFILVPAGEFMMGDDTIADAKPAHKVRITKPFYMGKYEVTQPQYEKVMGTNPSQFKGADLPVEKVSWDDAQKFVAQASGLRPQPGGLRYTLRLPTEAEWEYACRAGTTTDYNTGQGDAALEKAGWYNKNSGGKTNPVGKKAPNAWGLYDMHGNVWEWCQDWCGDKYYAESPPADPPGSTTGKDRVLRGGSWSNHPGNCRSAYRYRINPGYRNIDIGFRLRLDVPAIAVQPQTTNQKAQTGGVDDDARFGPWEDLFDGKSLAGWTVRDSGLFAKHGDVKVENGQLLVGKGVQGTAAARAGAFPSVDYELAFETKMPSGFVSFPVGTSQWAFFLMKDFAGDGSAAVGPVKVTTGSLVCTPKGGGKLPLEQGKWYGVRLRIAPHKITAWIDGQQRFEFDTTPHEADGRGGDDTLKPLAVFTWQGEGAIRALRLRRLKPEGATTNQKPQTGVPAGEPAQIGGYRIVKKLGGGMLGVAYEAEDVNLQRRIFIRVLADDFVAKPDWTTRFENGARARSKLAHPNIATLYNYGPYADRRYIATEFVDGDLLSEMIKREKALPWQKALDIAAQLAQGLKHAHDKGVILRDLKPNAVIVAKDSTPKVVDFFLALDLKAEQPALGVAVGTPHYMPPEQWRGDKIIDGRADIYALGATLWEMLAGAPPFRPPGNVKDLPAFGQKVATEPLPDLKKLKPDLPDALVKVIEKMLAKKPEDRYQSCDELLKALEGLKPGTGKAP